MPKFEVFIFGRIPDCILVEAKNKAEAEANALEQIIDGLTLDAEPEGTAERIPKECEATPRLSIVRRP